MDEYFDIVDENGKPTGKTELRSIVHTNGLWHRAVHIYFYKKTGNKLDILVHLRSAKKDLKPNCWDTRFGGHVRSGQTIDQAALEEVREETGLDIDLNHLTFGYIKKRKNFPNNEFYHVYFYNYTDDMGKLKFLDEEVQMVKWMGLEDIAQDIKNNPGQWAGTLGNFEEMIMYLKELV